MRVATILGTRPEIIRLSKIIPLLDNLLGAGDGHRVFHTGQNYDRELDTAFFEEFGLRDPDVHAKAGGGTFAKQLAIFLPRLEAWLKEFQPDRFLVLGDTNSSVGALIAARLGIPVYHLEAGNRCHGPQSPEEVNRRAIDHVSTVHLCYTERSRMNLVAEGIPLARTFVVGNPLAEVLSGLRQEPRGLLEHVNRRVLDDKAWERAGGGFGRPRWLATLHRQENVDAPDRPKAFLDAIQAACDGAGARCLMSTHPRTRAWLKGQEATWDRIYFSRPLPFGQFVAMEASADLVLSDSGTAPEECAITARPLVILRDYMERQEVLERGGAVLWAPGSPTPLSLAARSVMDPSVLPVPIPPEYAPHPVAATVARLLLSPVPPC